MSKPRKPYPDFPLFAHANGQWAKKVRGKLHYFGKWADPEAAHKQWMVERDYLLTGQQVPVDSLTVRSLCNQYMSRQRLRLETDEIGQSMFDDYLRACRRLVDAFDRRSLESLQLLDWAKFKASLSGLSPHSINRQIGYVQQVFLWAYQSRMIDRPMQFGPDFRKLPKRVLRKHDNAKPDKCVTADAFWKLFDAADVALRCWMLLGINCGFYAVDISTIERRHLEGNVINFARPKTGIDRRCWIWPETAAAIKATSQADGPLFLSGCGGRLIVVHANKSRTDIVKNHWVKARKDSGVTVGGFSSLRHTHRTITDGCGDQPAANLFMGHAQRDMADNYRHTISSERLQAVAEYVRHWLFKKKPESVSFLF